MYTTPPLEHDEGRSARGCGLTTPVKNGRLWQRLNADEQRRLLQDFCLSQENMEDYPVSRCALFVFVHTKGTTALTCGRVATPLERALVNGCFWSGLGSSSQTIWPLKVTREGLISTQTRKIRPNRWLSW